MDFITTEKQATQLIKETNDLRKLMIKYFIPLVDQEIKTTTRDIEIIKELGNLFNVPARKKELTDLKTLKRLFNKHFYDK